MLNGYVNENGNKINRSNWDKANFLEQHTFFVYFFTVVLHDLKLSSYTFYGGNVVCVHEKSCCPCSYSFVFFRLSSFSLCWPLIASV